MGILIGFVVIAIGAIAIGIKGGAHAAKSPQVLVSIGGTIVAYFLVVGIPLALIIMEREGGKWVAAFFDAYFSLARSLLLLGLIPLAIAFVVAWFAAR